MFLGEWLKELKIEENNRKYLISFTKLCMSQNIFQLDNKFYEQTKGTAMGDPLLHF